MKYFLLFSSIFFLLFQNYLTAQPCLPEGLHLSNQEDVDNFKNNYPNCTEIQGDLEIGSWSGSAITHLDSLNVLTSVWGELKISNNDVLTSLKGLDNLTTVGNGLRIYQNPSLLDLSGLSKLEVVSHILEIAYNDSLRSLSGLESLDTIYGQLTISSNPLIQNLDGLQALNAISWSIMITSNDTLSNLNGIDNLDHVGAILIWHNNNLKNIQALEKVENKVIMINLQNNELLESLDGLQNINIDSLNILVLYHNNLLSVCDIGNICDFLANPTGMVSVAYNAPGCRNAPEIASSCGFTLSCLPFGNYYFTNQDDIDNFRTDYQNCTQLDGSIQIAGTDISNLEGLNSVTTMASGDFSFFSIYGTELLTDLSDLESIESIGGHLAISNASGFVNFSGLENITEIGGDLYLYNNPSVINLEGLNNLKTINGSLNLNENKSLKDLNDLSNLDSIQENFFLTQNDSLFNLTGLDELEYVGGRFTVSANGSLLNFNGLESLHTVDGVVSISSNPLLTSLNGMQNIEANSIEELTITNNSMLTNCEVESVCDFLSLPNSVAYIAENMDGCNSRAEVEEACLTISVEGQTTKDSEVVIATYPNPFTGLLNIEYNLESPSNIVLSIRNILGEQVHSITQNQQSGKQITQWKPVKMPPGIYFIMLQTSEYSTTKKILKLR